VLTVVLLAGSAAAQAQDPGKVNVFVENGKIRVDQDPIQLKRTHVSNGRWQVSWTLADPKGYRFSDKVGIEILEAREDHKGPDDLRCNREANGARFVCSFKPRAGQFNHKYNISVDATGGGRILLDPTINTNF
jgi:hypothetical protein